MAEWSNTLLASERANFVGPGIRGWDKATPFPSIGADLTDGAARYLVNVRLFSNGRFYLEISQTNSSNSQHDLSSEFEANGSVTLEFGSTSLTVSLAGADLRDPYDWLPSNSADVIAAYNALTSNIGGTITIRDFLPAAPSFSDDTGDAISGTVGTSIANVTVPEADGGPTPTYAVVGTLPGGLAFNTTTRVLSGNPTGAGSGTITIRATNSAGTADWTVAYTFNEVPAYADNTGDAQSWFTGIAITNITVPAATGTPTPTYAAVGSLPAGIAFNATTRVLSGAPTAVGSGTIRIRATNSAGTADWTVAYSVVAANEPPSFSDNTGDAQNWTVGTSIAAVQVPSASGNPTPAYAVVGTLPSGLAFATGTRRITGTPTAAGSGTIRIRATNSQGSDDWTVTYTAAAAQTSPAFADNTGDAQSWFTDVAITSLTVPAATGTPTPTYAAVGSLPSGISFSTSTRVLSGTPAAAGSGTIRIRATNSEGTDDWTVAYSTVAPSITGITARSEGRSVASVEASYTDLSVGDTIYVRHREAGTLDAWAPTTIKAASTDGTDTGFLAGLASGTTYTVQASLASDYSSPQSITLDHAGTVLLMFDVVDNDAWEISDISTAARVLSTTSRLGALPAGLDEMRAAEEVDGWVYAIQTTGRTLHRSRTPLDLTSYELLGALPSSTAGAHSIFAVAGVLYGMTSNSIFSIPDPLDPSTAGPLQSLGVSVTVARGAAVIGSTLYVWDHQGRDFRVIPDISTPSVGTTYTLVGLPANFDVRGMTTFNGRLITHEEDQTELYEILGFTGSSPSVVSLGDYDPGALYVNAVASWSGNPGSQTLTNASAESVGVAEADARGIGQAIGESVAIAETGDTEVGLDNGTSDNVSVSETRAASASRSGAESISVADALQSVLAGAGMNASAESATVAESLAQSVGQPLDESASITDSLSSTLAAGLALSDWSTPAGIAMRVLALIETGTASGNEVFDTADNRGALLDGDNVLENVDGSGNSITVGRFQVASNGAVVTLNRSAGTAFFRSGFGGEAGEEYAGATTYIQTSDGTVVALTDGDANVGAGFLTYGVPASPSTWRTALATLRMSGTRFILGVGLPAATAHTNASAETVSVSEARAGEIGKAGAESVGVAETGDTEVGFENRTSENVAVAESRAAGASRTGAEAVGVSDSLQTSLSGAGNNASSDTAAVAESLAAGVDRGDAESVSMADARSAEVAHATSEGVTVADALQSTVSGANTNASAETIAVAESRAGAVSRAADEGVAVADALASTLAGGNVNDSPESVAIADALTSFIGQQIAERITVAELVEVGAPAQLSASGSTLTSVVLSWAAPYDGGSPILRYEYQLGTGAWVPTGSLDPTFELAGLAPGTRHTVAVRAVTALGTGPAAAAVTFATVAVAVPSAPLFPRATSDGVTLVLEWEPPLDDGGGAITAYEAMICDEADGNCGWETVWER